MTIAVDWDIKHQTKENQIHSSPTNYIMEANTVNPDQTAPLQYRPPMNIKQKRDQMTILFVCLFVLLLYVPSQRLWSWQDGQFT